MELTRLPVRTNKSKTNQKIANRLVSGRKSLSQLYQQLQRNPYACEVSCELGQRLREQGKLEEAYQVLKRYHKIDNGFSSLFEMSLITYQLERLDECFQFIQQALLVSTEEDPRLAEVFRILGNIFIRHGDYDSAEDAYNKALRVQPESDALQVNLGTLDIQREDWEAALEHFRSAINLKPNNDKAWVGLALCHRQRGDLELAWGNLETAIMWNPVNETALSLAMDWAAKDSRERQLLGWLREFLIAGGWSTQLSLAFVWLSWGYGDRPSAEIELERLLTTDPTCEKAWIVRRKMRASV